MLLGISRMTIILLDILVTGRYPAGAPRTKCGATESTKGETMTNRLKYEDMNGRRHPEHVVRSMGPGRGFGVVDVLTNVFVEPTGGTREEAWEDLRALEAKMAG
jgi:hypothetical protein